MHLDMRFWGSRQGEFSEVFVIFVPALCQFSLASRLERLDHLSIYVSIYVARSRTHPQIQFQPSPPFSRRAGPSYHLSRPAHVSVVREVPGIHTFAVQLSALLCKNIHWRCLCCTAPCLSMAQIFNSQTRLPCSALSQPCSCLVSESSNVGSKQAVDASKAIFEAMVVI